MSGVVLVLCTVPAAAATELSDALLNERLVACVNAIGPVSSRYVWEGQIESVQEVLLLAKTPAELAGELRERLGELHPYDVPEILEFDVQGGVADYLAWVRETCGYHTDA